jgi:hypothetical protein
MESLVPIAVTVLLNVVILLVKGGGVSTRGDCKVNHWGAYMIQFAVNAVIYGYVSRGRYPPMKLVQLWLLSIMGGFLLGLIGMGMALVVLIGLFKLKISTNQSITATLPLLLGVVTATGTIISLITGGIDVIMIYIYIYVDLIHCSLLYLRICGLAVGFTSNRRVAQVEEHDCAAHSLRPCLPEALARALHGHEGAEDRDDSVHVADNPTPLLQLKIQLKIHTYIDEIKIESNDH